MFETLLSLQSSDGSGGEGQLTPTEIAAAKMDEVLTKIDDVVFDAGRLLFVLKNWKKFVFLILSTVPQKILYL